MALIPIDEMNQLRPAEELAKVAQTAQEDLQLMRIAHALNTNANTGSTVVRVSDIKLFDSVKEQLEKQGYTIQFRGGNDSHYIISYPLSKEA